MRQTTRLYKQNIPIMKTLYLPPSIRVAEMDVERNYCASINVPNVSTGNNNGLEGWSEDPETGTWE